LQAANRKRPGMHLIQQDTVSAANKSLLFAQSEGCNA